MELEGLFRMLLLAFVISLLFVLQSKWRARRWPPGPPAWPIIGHLHLLGNLNPHQTLCKLSRSYGPLMGLRLGSVRVIVASSPQMAKQILQTHDLAFANRRSHSAAILHMFDGSMAFAPYGPLWKRLRQLCNTEFLNSKRLASFQHVREEEAQRLVKDIATKGQGGEQAVELRPGLLATSNNVICRMTTGKRLAEVSRTISSDDKGKRDLMGMVEEVLHLLGVFYVGDYIPWLWWMDPHGHLQRMGATGRKARALMQDVVHNRRQERQRRQQDAAMMRNNPPAEHLLDALLEAVADPKQEDPRLTDEHIIALLLDLLTEGSDTSAETIEWALADLISNKRVMDKLKEEINGVIGKERHVKERDIDNLPYLKLVLKESMRLHPVAPLLIPHESSKDCQIEGYNIPAKTVAYINTWAIARDPLLWDKPLEFWPERFENTNLDVHGKTFELLPFGVGRRGCPARELAHLNVHLILGTLVHAFDWSLSSSSHKGFESHTRSFDMSEKFGLSLKLDTPLCVFSTPKLPLVMY